MKKLKALLIVAGGLQLVYLFGYLRYYGDPFRDEAYVHLVIAICFVALASSWRFLDDGNDDKSKQKYCVITLPRHITPLLAVYIGIIVCFMAITAGYATAPETGVEGFSHTGRRMLAYGVSYFILTSLLLLFVFPVMTGLLIHVKEFLTERKLANLNLSLFWTLAVPVTLFILLIPVFYIFMQFGYIEPGSGPRPDWLRALPYLDIIEWLESPLLNIRFLPLGILLIGWSMLNGYLIRKYLKNKPKAEVPGN